MRLIATLTLMLTLAGFATADEATGKSIFTSNCAIYEWQEQNASVQG